MIAYIEGKFLQKTAQSIIIATRYGIGYEVFIPQGMALPAAGEELALYTAFVVGRRENGSCDFIRVQT